MRSRAQQLIICQHQKMGPKWILWLLVIFANPLVIFARSGRITFQKFELPALTPSIEEILENEKIGGKFIELWRSAMEMSTEFKVNYDENGSIIGSFYCINYSKSSFFQSS